MADTVRFTSIAPPPDNGCEGCARLKNQRTFCAQCRGARECTWCLGRGFAVLMGRWDRCSCCETKKATT